MKKYWISPNISYKTWLKICKRFPDSGPTPKESNRILWEMLRDRQINIFIMDIMDSDDPICITTKKIPKNAVLIIDPAGKGKNCGKNILKK